MKRTLLFISILFTSSLLFGQFLDTDLYRTLNGSYNNPNHPDWGQAGTNLLRVVPSAYTDGISSPAGWLRFNPRKISNTVFAQDSPIFDPIGLSDFCWVFGQFIDHDIGLTPDGNENFSIQVQTGDSYFDPLGQGTAIIPVLRNIYDPATGSSVANPRQHPNVITCFIDGSGVYGSDQERADWLRSFSGGKLKTSSGNMPPFNTTTGEFADPVDPNAPEMANATGISNKIYVVGDVRGNENALLTAFHTLFVREHNRICDVLAVKNPDWDDEQLYQHARKMVGGLIQSIVYEEWLPEMGLHLPEYAGYDPTVHPQLANSFTAAAYRLGHTLLSEQLMRIGEDGAVVPQGNILLKNAFFNPYALIEVGGIEPYFRGMGVQKQQMLDSRVVNAVRNFLFGPPGAGGLDLAAINIQRGRERGLPDFNTLRQGLGLPPYTNWLDINPDYLVYDKMHSVYQLNDIDPWVGMVAEEPIPGTLFGETVTKFMELQFGALRDGDRFFYQNDPVLTAEEKTWIKTTTLHDIIMLNTGVSIMQSNVFEAMPYEEICDHLDVDLTGNIHTPSGVPVPGVTVVFQHDNASFSTNGLVDGNFAISHVPGCGAESLDISKDGELLAGVTTYDLVLMSKHILGMELLDTPYKYIAADVNHSGSITTLDIINVRKAILGIVDSFTDNTSWRLVPANITFSTPEDALVGGWDSTIDFNGLLSMDYDNDFIAVKIGDVNASIDPSFGGEVEERFAGNGLKVQLEETTLKEGEIYSVDFYGKADQNIVGYQFALNYNAAALHLVQIDSYIENMGEDNFGVVEATGLISTSWNQMGTNIAFKPGEKMFSLVFEARQDGNLSDFISLNDTKIVPEAYDQGLNTGALSLEFVAPDVIGTEFALYQNYPNPFVNETVIPFYLPEDDMVVLSIFDVSGKQLFSENRVLDKGSHEWKLDRKNLPETGILFYQVETNSGSQTRRMLLTR